MAKVLIEEQYLHDIADSIRKMTGKKSPITTDSMAGEIQQAEIVWNPDEKWQRPIDWPDYSEIDLTDFEGMYFTYDTSKADHYDDWVSFYCTCSGGYKVERGQIVNGSFVADYTTTKSSSAVFEEWIESTITGYVVYRITPATASGHITVLGHRDMTATLRTDGRYNRTYHFQPLLERYGRLPELTSFSNWANYFVVSDTILDLKKITTLQNVWNPALRIENINLNGFDGKVTSLSQTFYCCRRLRYLNETDKFVTSTCTSLYYTFNECYSLPFVDCENWNTSNVTRMDNLFSSCHNLYKADVSNWNVSKVTIMTNIFNSCVKLKEIDISRWIVTLPTSFQAMFANCTRVETLDISGFNSSNVTSLYQMFYNCRSLKELDVSHFDTSKVTSLYQTFYGCMSLKELDVSNFNTSKVTSFAGAFEYTYNLEELDLSNFDFSAATSINSMCYGAGARLKEIKLPSTISSGVLVSDGINSAFGNNVSLLEIDLTGFNMNACTGGSIFRYDYSLEKVVLPDSLKAIGTYCFGDCRNLKTVVLPSTTLVTLANTNAFNNSRAKTIYVPDNLVASYRTASNWSSLTNVTFAGLSTYTG